MGFDWRPAMFCDPASCPTAWAGLIIGLLLALFAPWFFLRTRTAASVLVYSVTLRYMRRKFRHLSRVGRILSLIVAECLILPGLVVPALEHLLPLSPQLVQFLQFLRVVSFLVGFVLLFVVVYDRELIEDTDDDKQKE